MRDTTEPSGGVRALPPVIPDPASDSATANQPFLLSLAQTLEQNDSDGVASLEKSIKLAIATHRRALNEKDSPLLRLPTELIAMIGYLVTGDRGAVWLPCSTQTGARELNMRILKYTGYLPLVVEEGPINIDEARAIWESAKASKLRLRFAPSM